MTSRQRKQQHAINAWAERLESERDLYLTLVDFIAGELANGRTWVEIKAEIARRWPGTRYRLVLNAYDEARAAAL